MARHQRPRPQQPPADLPADTRIRKVATTGNIALDKAFYKVDVNYAFQHVLVVTDGDTITVTDMQGEILAEHTRPGPGMTYVGNGRPPGTRPTHPGVSPKS